MNNRHMNYEDYEAVVVFDAKKVLATRSWYQGVCLDTIRQSYDDGLDVKAACEKAIDDTTYWDAGK